MKLKKLNLNFKPLTEVEIRRVGNLLSYAKTKAIGTLLGKEYVHNEFNYIGEVEFPELSFLSFDNTHVYAIGILDNEASVFRYPRANLMGIEMTRTGFGSDVLLEVLSDKEMLPFVKSKTLKSHRRLKRRNKK